VMPMQCQSCQKHAAKVHQIEVDYPGSGTGPDDREIRELHLCPPCAKAAGIPVGSQVHSFPQMVSMLGKALLKGSMGVPAEKEAACPDCGWTLRDFRQTSRFGCPKDYEIFGNFVEDLLERLHGATEHPAGPEEADLARLSREMTDAVSREDYETAARLRDQIQGLEATLKAVEGSE